MTTATCTGRCRLCLELLAKSFSSIENPELREQMTKVFSFAIPSQDGITSEVCQMCSYTISDFYQYSEKVRLNQENLLRELGQQTPLPKKYKFDVESIKIEADSYEELDKSLNIKNIQSDNKETNIGMSSNIELASIDIKTELDSDEETEDFPENIDSNEPLLSSQLSSMNSNLATLNTETTQTESQISDCSTSSISETLSGHDKFLNEHFNIACVLCSATTLTFAKLRNHFRLKHGQNDAYVMCCNKKFAKRGDIVNHIKLHLNPDAFQCDLCEKRYKSQETLTQHKLFKHMDENLPDAESTSSTLVQGQQEQTGSTGQVEVEEENRAILTDDELDSEVAAKEDQYLSEYFTLTCFQCNATKPTFTELRHHFQTAHCSDQVYVTCCKEKFSTRSRLISHIKSHGNAVHFSCEYCGKPFATRFNRRRHINAIHKNKDEAPFQVRKCDICEKEYPSFFALQCHKKAKHVEKKHECEFCGRKFKELISLREHRTVHTGEMLYTCEFCNQRYQLRTTMYSHIKRKHAIEWANKKKQRL